MISVRHTMEPVLNRTKTVSRRDGWWERKNGTRQLVVGQRLRLCDQTMGLRGRSPIVVGIVHVGSVTREPLGEITDADVAREGFPHMTAIEFVKFYTTTFRVEPDLVLTRIGWSYAPGQPALTDVIPALVTFGNLPTGSYPSINGGSDVHYERASGVWTSTDGTRHQTHQEACGVRL